jgi:hypothetical protein
MQNMDEIKYSHNLTLPEADFYFAETILDLLSSLHHPCEEGSINCELCHRNNFRNNQRQNFIQCADKDLKTVFIEGLSYEIYKAIAHRELVLWDKELVHAIIPVLNYSTGSYEIERCLRQGFIIKSELVQFCNRLKIQIIFDDNNSQKHKHFRQHKHFIVKSIYRLTVSLQEEESYLCENVIEDIVTSQIPLRQAPPDIYYIKAKSFECDYLRAQLYRAVDNRELFLWNSTLDKFSPPPAIQELNELCQPQLRSWTNKSYILKTDLIEFCKSERILLLFDGEADQAESSEVTTRQVPLPVEAQSATQQNEDVALGRDESPAKQTYEQASLKEDQPEQNQSIENPKEVAGLSVSVKFDNADKPVEKSDIAGNTASQISVAKVKGNPSRNQKKHSPDERQQLLNSFMGLPDDASVDIEMVMAFFNCSPATINRYSNKGILKRHNRGVSVFWLVGEIKEAQRLMLSTNK